MSESRVVGAILAGGRSSRMGGRPKGLELLGERRVVDRVRDALAAVTGEVVVLGGDPKVAESLGVRLVPDEVPGQGPLGAIVSGLRATGADLLVLAWDMPWVTGRALRPLLRAPAAAGAAGWKVGKVHEPLCMLYRQRLLEPLAAAVEGGERRARAAAYGGRLVLFDGSTLPPETFRSINTETELREARERPEYRDVAAP